MNRLTKVVLVLAVVSLLVGFILNSGLVDVKNVVALYAVLPVGAAAFGLFLILRMLERESAAYDEENHATEHVSKKGI